MHHFINFKTLHEQKNPLILPNVWDVKSALTYEKLGFTAVGTSSAAVADSLGYEDGQQVPFEHYLFVINRIRAAVSIPFSVDLEAGYGKNTDEIIVNVLKLTGLNIAGINIEDSVVKNGKRSLLPPAHLSQVLNRIRTELAKRRKRIFLNVRTDTFLLNVENKCEETIKRIKAYESAGADGIFIPGITDPADIRLMVSATHLPLNVMCINGLPGFSELRELGVKRISMGNFGFNYMYQHLARQTEEILADDNFKSILA